MPAIPLIDLNWSVKLPGYAEPFETTDMSLDSVGPTMLARNSTLLVRTPEGIVSFKASEQAFVEVEVVDLAIPSALRDLQADKGWMRMTMTQLIEFLVLIYCGDD
jgi:hypothetical protein